MDEQVRVVAETQLCVDGLGVQVHGLEAAELVTIDVSTRDFRDVLFQSQATYVARSDGTVDTRYDAPVSGSYEGVDAFGLLWSQHAPTEDWTHIQAYRAAVAATGASSGADGTLAIMATAWDDDVVQREYAFSPLKATVLEHREPVLEPLIVFGGTAGERPLGWARLLANRGRNVIVMPSCRKDRRAFDPKVFKEAVQYALDLPGSHDRCNIPGFSLGAQAAVLVARLSNRVGSLALVAPSRKSLRGVVQRGVDWQFAWEKEAKKTGLSRLRTRSKGPNLYGSSPPQTSSIWKVSSARSCCLPVEMII